MPIYRVIEPKLGKLRYRQWRKSAGWALAMLMGISAASAVGLFVFDGSNAPIGDRLFDAVWNTVNTIATIGYYTDLTRGQRVFLIFTMLMLVTGVSYAITALTGILSNPDVLTYRENRRMARVLAAIEGHVIVVGFGGVGELVAEALRAAGNTVVIVDVMSSAVTTAADRQFVGVLGAAEEEDTLKAAGVERAKAMVITTEDATRKLTITLMARAFNAGLYITTVGDDQRRGAWLTHAGASDVVVVDRLIADALVAQLRRGVVSPASTDTAGS